MKEGWKLIKLDELCVIERGGSPRPIDAFLTADADGINWIKISDATASGKYIYKTEQKIKPEGAKCSRIVNEGDFILSNSMSFGRPYIMKTNGCIHDGWLVLRQPKVNPDYLYLVLGSDFVYQQFDRLASGSTVRNLNIGLVKSVEIPVPSELEQQRIVAILDEAFEAISAARANAEQNSQNARALFESYLQSVFSQRGDGWVERKLGDQTLLRMIDGDRGTNYPKATDFLDHGPCLFLNTKNVRPNGFEFDSTMFISAEKDAQLRKGKLQRNDVVMTTRGTIGNIGLYSEEVPFDSVRINSGMLIFRANQTEILPAYLFEILRSGIVKEQINKYTTGAAQPQLPIKTLVNFSIPVPTTLAGQSELVKRIRDFEPETQRLESLYQRKIAALDELKQSLLQQAFSGQLDTTRVEVLTP